MCFRLIPNSVTLNDLERRNGPYYSRQHTAIAISEDCFTLVVLSEQPTYRFSDSEDIFMAAICNRTGHYIFALWFLLSFCLSLFSSPNLSSRRLDVFHTSTHDVALVQIHNAGLKCAARGALEMQDPKIRRLRTIAQLCRAISSQLRHISTIGKTC